MNKRLLTLVLLFASVIGVRAAAPSFSSVLDSYYEEYLALYPVDAATYGDSDTRYEAVWPIEIGTEHRAKVGAMCEKYLAKLAGYDRAALTPSEQLSYDTLKWSLTARADQNRQIMYLLPVNQFWSP